MKPRKPLTNNLQQPPPVCGTGHTLVGPPLGQIYQVSNGMVQLRPMTSLQQEEDAIAYDYLRIVILKIFHEQPVEFIDSILDIFCGRSFNEIYTVLQSNFSESGVEFLKEMSDEEIINYLRLVC